ncbi:ribosomal protein L4 domain-containing protein [Geranomyces variabilis]|nr:ribosomal protein L4 domain-containing protein [Geranomyces variabilis]KAJ3140321.1 54S ribosomal protein L4 mitochondrial [Geranomyces variabilis]
MQTTLLLLAATRAAHPSAAARSVLPPIFAPATSRRSLATSVAAPSTSPSTSSSSAAAAVHSSSVSSSAFTSQQHSPAPPVPAPYTAAAVRQPWTQPLNSFLRSFATAAPLGILELDRSVFGSAPRKDLLARAIRYEEAWRLQGTESTKNLGQVRGSTRKPFQQKGRGKARVGTVRAPQWRGGYIVHGPRPHLQTIDLPRKVYASALRSALSAKFLQNQLLVVDSLHLISPLKAALADRLAANDLLNRKVYLLYGSEEPEQNLVLASNKFWNRAADEDRGLPQEKQILVASARNVMVGPLLENELLVCDKAAIEALEEMYHVE